MSRHLHRRRSRLPKRCKHCRRVITNNRDACRPCSIRIARKVTHDYVLTGAY